ncbi:bifunctional UDP-N-acetylglucosamine diphosphorylase/glucosamine-1-phosphate N-acetyltransferase GlmU [Corynebacterium sp. TAE3-ERU12]|uniref:bifunctional UDP-N-acetylglucosamine diphosphorylase/glucosamine-1-phosphate N-acetyltransferase GlmU n=1 Tax=Corynebacterium sp. TAE3-ERU12 TaxID=2849491 RepID=UPI001C476AEF|nr:bifunctional UDP-N-acetylglucosamine diphosphorylase/glucosamine-1-phosphate N-acetyltransferase GlmU [Corynebacterium sp. TAE3-ERU12]MBV7295688.1 bifunctional UDP-N-acetylglucosamine diphosphorylase/glucosamine-1-phosphate N-acetyltransferase GlmU [Corynebacterium sp. TAE3-ERU12]
MSTESATAVVILAAGQGTRMRSQTPKVLHKVAGRSMLDHALFAAHGAGADDIIAVVGHQKELVVDGVARWLDANPRERGVGIAHQQEQNGTGHAVQCAFERLDEPGQFHGTVIVTTSDVPMLNEQVLRDLLTEHERSPKAAVTVLTASVDDPHGYGRILRTADGEVTGIVEEKDATDSQRTITEINSGVYAFDADTLRKALTMLDTDNAQGELYLTDVIGIARSLERSVRGHRLDDEWLIAGANDRVQLARIGAELNHRLCEAAMRGGATIVDPATTWLGMDVEIGQDVTILPGTQLYGATRIADGATIGPDTTLDGVTVGEGASVVRTHAIDCEIGKNADVGPFTYIRPKTVLAEGAKLGGFVEAKNAQIGAGSKVPHLTYIGDATVGEQSNIGASSVFVNYDGVNKHHTTIGNHVRTGSDTMFIAPVTVGDGAYSGAGTVIREDVPPGALAVSGGKQRNIEGWVQQKRPGTPAADAADSALAEGQPDTDQEG